MRVRMTTSEEETRREASRIAGTLGPGDLLVLTGALGAGKTAFVRGLAEGFGLDPREVRSPSFALVREYGPGASGLRLVHADLYRIENILEADDLGLTERLQEHCVVAVEWGEKLPARLRADAFRIILEDAGGTRRRLTIHGKARAQSSW